MALADAAKSFNINTFQPNMSGNTHNAIMHNT